ncbi:MULTISPECIES: hypothetical protein [Paenibacillus]|uniref:Uncharacterized protein n=2 Tax=Paenibacillus TaxID=44249 RepID=A0A1V4HT34_9BACL|nr:MULTISPECIES: hypothetical protein [Paenibacillus]MEC0231465.1 hypothetical protein [Paenibacillus alba]NQX65864.1 hypothetical protein [Paenibacillus alba]OPH62026.1 hypothetical protein BC351_01945 [Paenibacillus ferrarius]
MTLELTGLMLYAMYVVVGLMGISFLVGLYQSLKAGTFSYTLILNYLQDLLFYVFPLFLLANMKSMDPTGWILLIAYYIGALGVAIKYLASLKK